MRLKITNTDQKIHQTLVIMNKFLEAKATNWSSSTYKSWWYWLLHVHCNIHFYLFQSYQDLIGFHNKSINFCISPIPEFSKSVPWCPWSCEGIFCQLYHIIHTPIKWSHPKTQTMQIAHCTFFLFLFLHLLLTHTCFGSGHKLVFIYISDYSHWLCTGHASSVYDSW